jgi:hypothetical protein
MMANRHPSGRASPPTLWPPVARGRTRVFDGRDPSCVGDIVLPGNSHPLKGALS